MADPIGFSFQPGADAQQMRDQPVGGGGGARGLSPQQAVRVLSLRVPNVLPSNAPVNHTLLTSPGSAAPGASNLTSMVRALMEAFKPSTPTPAPTMPSASPVPPPPPTSSPAPVEQSVLGGLVQSQPTTNPRPYDPVMQSQAAWSGLSQPLRSPLPFFTVDRPGDTFADTTLSPLGALATPTPQRMPGLFSAMPRENREPV